MKPSFTESLKRINPTAAALGAGLFMLTLLAGGNPLANLSSYTDIALAAGSQILGSSAILVVAGALAQKNMRKKLLLTSAGQGMNALQFTLLAAAGIHSALGGVLSMSVATVRGLFFAAMTNPATGETRLTRRQSNIAAFGFVGASVGFAFTGFGVVPPLVSASKLLSGDLASVGMMLPIAASACGAFGDAASRMRYMRPIKAVGAFINCAYNLGFSGALSHLIGEASNIAVHAHQLLTVDMPPAKFKGKKLTLQERIKGYLELMRNPKLSEEYYPNCQHKYVNELQIAASQEQRALASHEMDVPSPCVTAKPPEGMPAARPTTTKAAIALTDHTTAYPPTGNGPERPSQDARQYNKRPNSQLLI